MATNAIVPVAGTNRRRRVRHKIQTPAYAVFPSPESAKDRGALLELHEIVNLSEEGMAIQCHSPLGAETSLDLSLDLAECSEQIQTTGQVIWSNSGRVGLRFSELPPASLARLREWLFVNVMSGAADGEPHIPAAVKNDVKSEVESDLKSEVERDLKSDVARDVKSAVNADLKPEFNADLKLHLDRIADPQGSAPSLPNFTDTLAAIGAVERQVEALGSDLKRALDLIAESAQNLTRSSGAAVALAGDDAGVMVCRASAGAFAPPVGARLQVGSGFSGECVKSGTLLRCDDTEADLRVDRESCRALGVRSILAAPVRVTGESVGLIEVFSPEADSFHEGDETVLRRLAEAVLEAANRAARSQDLPPLGPPPAAPFSPPGSVLFASADPQNKKTEMEKSSFGITLPRSHLIILVCAATTIFFALGWGLAPWIQADALPWIHAKVNARSAVEHTQLQTVLASTHAPRPDGSPAIETATLDQLRQWAEKGSPDAQNALGLRYALGDGVKLNETEAVRWFSKAAELGNVPAQSKLGAIYFSGRGVPQNPNAAYFWMMIASSGGDDASKTLAPFVRDRLTRAQVTSIEFEADRWLQEHRLNPKPAAGQLRARF